VRAVNKHASFVEILPVSMFSTVSAVSLCLAVLAKQFHDYLVIALSLAAAF
jgi:hypothetical protein